MTDEQRDAHLRQALRHAPDAQARPPQSLSDAILREAHAKARDAAPLEIDDAPRGFFITWWDRLTQPALTTGLAGVMVATLVGLMWWKQPMDEAMPTRPEVVAQAPAPAQTPAPSPDPAASSAPIVAPRAEAAGAAESADTTRRTTSSESKPVPAPAPEAVARKQEPPPPARSTLPEREALRELAPAATTDAAPTPTPSPAAVAVAAPPAAPSAAAVGTASPGAQAESRSEPSVEANRSRSMATLKSNPADSTSERTGAVAALASPKKAQSESIRSSISALRGAITANPARWSWQRGSGAESGTNAALISWLAQLDDAAGNRWEPRTIPYTALPLGPELRLVQDDGVVHRLRLTERGALWQGSTVPARQVNLSPEAVAALEAALNAATR